ncbi:hypothetical protein [Halorubrum sp. CBA1125]|uniref:hypothetical protein n=1 Tax=Halorubrum sp. CBA1125 TaxID=2668072 RepID=UPI0018D23988|nr:hypothetical protein [Halorubrum sp. CBA1125]
MGDRSDRKGVQSHTEYARTRTRCPSCGAHVPAIGRDVDTTECPNCKRPVQA